MVMNIMTCALHDVIDQVVLLRLLGVVVCANECCLFGREKRCGHMKPMWECFWRQLMMRKVLVFETEV